MNKKLLGTYLNDHLAAADAAIELARRCVARNPATPVADCVAELMKEFEEDRGQLLGVMGALGVRKRMTNHTLASLAEKAGRLRPDGAWLSYTDLARVLDLETLRVGIEGKRCLWSTLQHLDAHGLEIGALDFDLLLERASHQQLSLERHRLAASERALLDESSSSEPPLDGGGRWAQQGQVAQER